MTHPTPTAGGGHTAGPCSCVAMFNAKLADYNAALVTTMFHTPERVCIETYKLDAKKRGSRPPKILASFCPFCGQDYAQAKASSHATEGDRG